MAAIIIVIMLILGMIAPITITTVTGSTIVLIALIEIITMSALIITSAAIIMPRIGGDIELFTQLAFCELAT